MYWRVPWQDAWPHSLLYPGRTLPIPAAVILHDLFLSLRYMGLLTRPFPTTAAPGSVTLPFLHGCRGGPHSMAAPRGQRSSINKRA